MWDNQRAGAIRSWAVIGPFDDTDWTGPGKNLPDLPEIGSKATVSGKTGPVGWQSISIPDDHSPIIDLVQRMREINRSMAVISTGLHTDEARTMYLSYSTSQLGSVWLNGKFVGKDEIAAGILADEHRIPLKLHKGWNRLVIRSHCLWGRTWAVSAVLSDESGMPPEDLVVDPLMGKQSSLPEPQPSYPDNVPLSSVTINGGVELKLATIFSGEFVMGDYEGNPNEQPLHRVYVNSFEIGITEITQEQYAAVTGENPSLFKESDTAAMYYMPEGPAGKRPVELVTWYDAARFCNMLSDVSGLERCYDEISWKCDYTKNGFRLPSEAEWEYACRAGSETMYYAGNTTADLDKSAWYSANSSNSTQPVAKKNPNRWGIYDMLGNVYEWTNDWYADTDYYAASPYFNPEGPSSGYMRVFRGGCWFTQPKHTRVSYRDGVPPNHHNLNLGFRVARSLEIR